DKPVMCGEFWTGWFDRWGGPHHKRDLASVTDELEAILREGGSLSFYMFHGGTNFGFMAGANYDGQMFTPDVTSYDFGAPLNEYGEPTEKYFACREVIRRFAPVPDIALPAAVS
ncbi:MAG: beta-galactosidase, partial [Kiritimatiellia bacterium]